MRRPPPRGGLVIHTNTLPTSPPPSTNAWRAPKFYSIKFNEAGKAYLRNRFTRVVDGTHELLLPIEVLNRLAEQPVHLVACDFNIDEVDDLNDPDYYAYNDEEDVGLMPMYIAHSRENPEFHQAFEYMDDRHCDPDWVEATFTVMVNLKPGLRNEALKYHDALQRFRKSSCDTMSPYQLSEAAKEYFGVDTLPDGYYIWGNVDRFDLATLREHDSYDQIAVQNTQTLREILNNERTHARST